MWHNGLLFKLLTYHNFPLPLIALLNTYLQDRTIRVRVEGALSGPQPISSGVPQGTVISPILYNLYTSDMPLSPLAQTIAYANDILIYSNSFYAQAAKRKLTHHLTFLTPYFKLCKVDFESPEMRLLGD